MRRIFVLGGSGFIGSEVMRVLRDRPDTRIMALAHRRIDYRALEDVNLVTGSLPGFDLEWLEQFRPDTVVHAARMGGRGPWRRSLAAWRGRRANERLVEWLSKHAPTTRVIYVSGTLVYGSPGSRPATEQTELDPIAYARQYIRAEIPWMRALEEGRLPIVIVRPPWVVGSGSWFRHHFVGPARRFGWVPFYGDGGNWMSFVDVRDCARAIVRLDERGTTGKVLNIFAPDQVTRQRDFAAEVANRMGLDVQRIGPRSLRERRDPAVREALTSSLIADTGHSDLHGLELLAPRWQDMVEYHLDGA